MSMDTDDQYVPAAVIPTPGTSKTGVQKILEGTRPWVLTLSVIGFCMAGLLVLLGVASGGLGLATRQPAALVFLIVYPLFGLLYVFPSLYLFRYARSIRDFVSSGHEQHLENALVAQRSFWKFVGIWSIVGVVLTILGVAAALVIAAAAALHPS
jgi:hypothetical protein